jgi:hypothetical protein
VPGQLGRAEEGRQQRHLLGLARRVELDRRQRRTVGRGGRDGDATGEGDENVSWSSSTRRTSS